MTINGQVAAILAIIVFAIVWIYGMALTFSSREQSEVYKSAPANNEKTPDTDHRNEVSASCTCNQNTSTNEGTSKDCKTQYQLRQVNIAAGLNILTGIAAIAGLFGLYILYGTLQATTKQLELSERPWVALEELRLLKPPHWEIRQLPKYVGRKELTTFINLHIPMTYILNNVGKSPAIRTFDYLEATPVHIERNFTKPAFAMEMACAGAESASNGASLVDSVERGKTIFPGNPINGSSESIYNVTQKDTPMDRVWVAVCIVYQAGLSPHLYHTKMWFVSRPKDERAADVPILPDEKVVWQPFDTLTLYDSEAD